MPSYNTSLKSRITDYPAMSDLFRFEISQVFLLENLCNVCLRKHRCVKIGVGLPVGLEAVYQISQVFLLENLCDVFL